MLSNKRGTSKISLILLILVIVISTLLYFLVELETQKIVLLIVIIFALLFGLILIYGQYFSKTSQLRRKLQKIEQLVAEESPDTLKDIYVEIYNLYLKLSERQKANFYPRLMKLRERIEEQFKAEKRLEELLSKAGQGALSWQKKIFDEINVHFQKLSRRVQEKYYPGLVRLKEKLEKGL